MITTFPARANWQAHLGTRLLREEGRGFRFGPLVIASAET